MKRKIVEQGGLTLMISLPREWAKKQGLKKGDEVELKESGKQLVITPEKEATIGRVEIDITNLDKSLIWRYFGAAYRRGCEEIKLTFKQNSEAVKEIPNITGRFIGMDLVEQGKDYYIMRELTASKPEEFDSILKKTFQLLVSMGESISEAAKANNKEALQNMRNTDKVINKFADYCFRILNQKGYKDTQKIIAYYVLIKQLEDIGDDYKNLAEEIARTKVTGKTVTIISEISHQLGAFSEIFYEFNEAEMLKLSKQQKNIDKKIILLPDKNMIGYLKKINTTIIDMTDAMMMARA